MSNSSKNLITFVLGAAVGAGIAYLFLSDDGKEILAKLKDKASTLTDELGGEIATGKDIIEDIIDQLKDTSEKA
jgi:gas vesicle protein